MPEGDLPQADEDGYIVLPVEGSLGAWEYAYHTSLADTSKGRKLLDAIKSFDVGRIEEIQDDAFLLLILDTPSPNMTMTEAELESSIHKELKSRMLCLQRPENVEQIANTDEEGELEDSVCVLQVEWFYEILDGADVVEACKKWEILADRPITAINTVSVSSEPVSAPGIDSSPAPEVKVPTIPVSPVEGLTIQFGTVSINEVNPSIRSPKEQTKELEAHSPNDSQTSSIEEQVTPSKQNPADSQLNASKPPSVEVFTEIQVPNPVEPSVGKVFTKNQLLPLTFHVISGPAQKSVEKMITEQGGGILVPRNRASIIVDLDLDPKAQDWKSEVWISPDGSRGLVPLGWVLACLAGGSLIDLRAYEKEKEN